MTDITIDELQDQQDSLNRTLREAIERALRAFKDRTGVSISSVEVRFIESTALGDRRRQYAIASVTTSLEMERL